MSDTLWRRMMVADTIHWVKRLWFCKLTGLHSPAFVFMPTPSGYEYYPSFKCELCGKEIFQ